jgi:hypothetical protein
MTSPRRPAAYIRIPGAGGWARHAMAREASYRGWPTPTVYAEDDSNADGGYGQALQRLERAIAAGRHDALLIAAPGNPGRVMGLLSRCTQHGVAVSFLPGPAADVTGAAAAPPAGVQAQSWVAPGPPVRQSGAAPGPSAEAWDVLAQARLEALAGLFPGWRIWLDRHGWHARRRGDYMQGLRPGAPAFHVSAQTALDLAAQLCWQQAAENYAPDGCQASTGTRAHVV